MSAEKATVTMPAEQPNDKKRKNRDEEGSDTLNRSEKKMKNGDQADLDTLHPSEETNDGVEADLNSLTLGEEMKDDRAEANMADLDNLNLNEELKDGAEADLETLTRGEEMKAEAEAEGDLDTLDRNGPEADMENLNQGEAEMKNGDEADLDTLNNRSEMRENEPLANFDLNLAPMNIVEVGSVTLNPSEEKMNWDEAESSSRNRSDKKRKNREEEDSDDLNRREKKKGKLHDDPEDPESLIPDLGRDNSITCLVHVPRSKYAAIATLNRNFRSLIRSGELYYTRRRLGVVEHWIYFSVSFNEWQAYDPSTMKWMPLPRMVTDECFMFSDKESLAVGTELMVFGRGITSHVVHKYSLISNSWSMGTPLNTPRCLFASGSWGTIGIIAGGCDPSGMVLSVVEIYNSETGVWMPLPDMNKARKMCSAVFMDGKFYVVGGIDVDRNPLTCSEVFDFETMTWEVIPNMYPRPAAEDGAPMQHSTEAPPLIGVVANELYLADPATYEIRKYNKGANLWEAIGELPDWVSTVNGWGIGFRACGERLMVIGGPRAPSTGITLNSWIPNEEPPEWIMLESKPLGSFVYNCAVMGC